MLVVEDDVDDYALLVRHLTTGGYRVEARRVESAEDMRAALVDDWDIVISDWALPTFSALGALTCVHERNLEVAVIIVSGVVDEELAVEALRHGAHDFVSKDRMVRLLPAVARELREATVRAERNRMREHLAISERMASVGVLAAGVAHEVNNPLAALVANLELAARRVADLAPADAALAAELADARAAATQIRDVVADLTLFARPRGATGPTDLHQVLESTLRLAANEIRHRARLVRKFAPVPPIEANPARLGQVFLNLIVNAVHAIPEGRADSNEICITTSVAANDRIVVEVRDTGVGIDPEVRKQLFAPFVSTTKTGVGMGLGLSICHRIVTTLGGEITVESQPGYGSKFRVWLPAAPAATTLATAPSARAEVERRGHILIVDDDVLVAKAIQRALRGPYDVEVMHRGQAVLDVLRDGARFDVILCDLMMPEMTGIELYTKMAAAWPEQAARVIFVTGGAFSDDARTFLSTVACRTLYKPFGLAELDALIDDKLRVTA